MDSSDEGTDNEGQRVRSTEKKKNLRKIDHTIQN